MTVKQAAGRLKHAALVLAGYRPVGVRFDAEDERIACEVAEMNCVFIYESEWYAPGLADETSAAIRAAIREYITYESERRREKALTASSPLDPDDRISI